jgi:hypothetical protein
MDPCLMSPFSCPTPVPSPFFSLTTLCICLALFIWAVSSPPNGQIGQNLGPFHAGTPYLAPEGSRPSQVEGGWVSKATALSQSLLHPQDFTLWSLVLAKPSSSQHCIPTPAFSSPKWAVPFLHSPT